MTDVDEFASIRTEGDSWDITESVGATASVLLHAQLAEETR